MINRFLLVFVGFISGLGVMGCIYHLKLASYDIYFNSPVGMPISVVVKIAFTLGFLTLAIFMIIAGPAKEEKGGESVSTIGG